MSALSSDHSFGKDPSTVSLNQAPVAAAGLLPSPGTTSVNMSTSSSVGPPAQPRKMNPPGGHAEGKLPKQKLKTVAAVPIGAAGASVAAGIGAAPLVSASATGVEVRRVTHTHTP